MSRTRRRKQFLSVLKLICERLDHFAPDFITTWTSSGANRHSQVLRLRVVLLREALDARQHRRSQSPTPAGMHCRKRASHRIAEQNRNAIRRFYSGQHTLCITDNHIAENRVAPLVLSGFRFFLRLDHAHVSAVNLPATCQRPVAGKKLEKPATILQNVLCRVVVETGETQRIERHRADAAETRRETVDETVLFEWSADEGTYAAGLAPVKSCCV